MSLPPDLLAAITAREGGKVALVIGAGCSVEEPTGLPLSGTLAESTHAKLVADGVLKEGDCDDPSDLSLVADAVFAKTGSQEALVQRFPVTEFRNAAANTGYEFAAALLRERAIADVMTLNFDLAGRHALAAANAGADVAVVTGPRDAAAMSLVNFIHLHGDAHAPADEWILRTEQLEKAWRGGWGEVIATRVMAAPVVVFAGLGTAAAAIVETTRLIREAVQNHVSIQVDPGAYGTSLFTETLRIERERHVQAGWCDFMQRLADRLAQQHVSQLRDAVSELERLEELAAEDVTVVFDVLGQMTLLELGRLRARCLLSNDSYLPARKVNSGLIADLIQAAAILARELQLTYVADPEGRLQMRRGDVVVGVLRPASGGGTKSWSRFETAVVTGRSQAATADRLVVLAAGVVGPRTAVAPPPDLIADEEPEDIGHAGPFHVIIDVHELRTDPDRALADLR